MNTFLNGFAPAVTDGYKPTHIDFMVPGNTSAVSNLTPRSNKFFPEAKQAMSFGHHSAWTRIISLWNETFFNVPYDAVEQMLRVGFDHCYHGLVDIQPLLDLHKLGYLPINVWVVPEGELVDMQVPLAIVYNTHPGFPWIVNYLEQIWSNNTWKMVVNATIAYELRVLCEKHAAITMDDTSKAKDICIDFSGRGMSNHVDSIHSGMCHLASHNQSDTIGAVYLIKDLYGEWPANYGAVRATEHAIATAHILYREQQLLDTIPNEKDRKVEAEFRFMLFIS